MTTSLSPPIVFALIRKFLTTPVAISSARYSLRSSGFCQKSGIFDPLKLCSGSKPRIRLKRQVVVHEHAVAWRSCSTLRPGISTMSRNLRSLSCSAFCAARSSVWSRKTSTTPVISPFSSRMGAPLSAMGRSVPSLAMSSEWLASPTTMPSRRTRATGLSTSARVSSLTIWNTSAVGRPFASTSDQPVSASATRFICRTLPSASVEMTASPML